MDYGTPQWLFDLLNAKYGPFVLDAAASADNAKCKIYLTSAEDGLAQPWLDPTFCNPPYGRDIWHWVDKAKRESEREIRSVLVIPARVETNWWHDYVLDGAHEILFVKGRIDYVGGNYTSTFPTAIVRYAPGHAGLPSIEHWDAKREREREAGIEMATKKSNRKTNKPTNGQTAAANSTPEHANVGIGAASVADILGGDAGATTGAAIVELFPTVSKTQAIAPFEILTSNIKGMRGDVKLEALNVVCGENRTGKTSVRVAFELALTGKAPGCVHAADYLEFAPSSAERISSMLVGPGGTAHYEVALGARPPSSPEFFGELKKLSAEDRALMLPGASMKSFLVGDKKAREAIFRRFGQTTTAGGVPKPSALSSEQEEYWSRSVAEVRAESGNGDDFAAILSDLSAHLRSRKTGLGREAGALERQLDDVRAKLAVAAAGAERIPELERLYQQAIGYESAATTRNQLVQARAEFAAIEEKATQFLSDVEALKYREEQGSIIESELLRANVEIKAQMAAIEPQLKAISDRLRRVQSLDEILSVMSETGVHECPVCASPSDPSALRARLQAVYADRQAQHEAIRTQWDQFTRQVVANEAKIRSAKVELESLKASHDRQRAVLKATAQGIQSRIVALESSLIASSAMTPPARSSVEIQAEISGLRSTEGLKSTIEQLEAQIRASRQEQTIAKTLEKEAEELLQTLLVSAAHNAESAINCYLPSGFTSALSLADGGCEWRIIGADGRAHNIHTMSGAEKSSLLVALALAWTDGAPFRALTLDDEDIGPFHSSPQNLQALLSKLRSAVDDGKLNQVIICGVRESEAPAGWNIVKR